MLPSLQKLSNHLSKRSIFRIELFLIVSHFLTLFVKLMKGSPYLKMFLDAILAVFWNDPKKDTESGFKEFEEQLSSCKEPQTTSSLNASISTTTESSMLTSPSDDLTVYSSSFSSSFSNSTYFSATSNMLNNTAQPISSTTSLSNFNSSGQELSPIPLKKKPELNIETSFELTTQDSPTESSISDDKKEMFSSLDIHSFTLTNMAKKYVDDMKWDLNFQNINWNFFVHVLSSSERLNTIAFVGVKLNHLNENNNDSNNNSSLKEPLKFEVSWEIRSMKEQVRLISLSPVICTIEEGDEYVMEFTNEEFNFEPYLSEGITLHVLLKQC